MEPRNDRRGDCSRLILIYRTTTRNTGTTSPQLISIRSIHTLGTQLVQRRITIIISGPMPAKVLQRELLGYWAIPGSRSASPMAKLTPRPTIPLSPLFLPAKVNSHPTVVMVVKAQ